jgi:hypothetical protein
VIAEILKQYLLQIEPVRTEFAFRFIVGSCWRTTSMTRSC